MRVLINAIAVRGGGPETFLLGLLPELLSVDSANEYVLLIPEGRAHLYASMTNRLVLRTVPIAIIESTPHRLIYEHIALTDYQRRDRFDVHFRADELLSPLVCLLGIPTIAVFHSTAHMLIPDQIGDSRLKLFYLQRMKALTMRMATAPVTVSYHARAELSGLYHFARQRIRVIYHGINHGIFKPAPNSQSSPLAHLGIERYALSVSDRHAHKNFPRLIHAYALLCKENPIPEHLVIVGRAKWPSEERRIAEAIQVCGLQGRVHLLDYMGQSELARLYRGAKAYVISSMFETFGLTPLEAMACGVPVACARYSAMPEVCGDAVEYFDPLDIADMARALETVLRSNDRRQELVQLGFKHIQYFNWRRAAQQYYKLMQEVAQKR